MKILAVLAVLLIPPAGFAETRFVTTRASKSFTGGGPNDLTWLANTSANGQYVIFKSWASNIVSDDSNKRSDFFIFDGKTNTTKQISLPYVETEPPTTEWVYDLEDVPSIHTYNEPAISADGQFAVFASSKSNLVPNDTNHESDAY